MVLTAPNFTSKHVGWGVLFFFQTYNPTLWCLLLCSVKAVFREGYIYQQQKILESAANFSQACKHPAIYLKREQLVNRAEHHPGYQFQLTEWILLQTFKWFRVWKLKIKTHTLRLPNSTVVFNLNVGCQKTFQKLCVWIRWGEMHSLFACQFHNPKNCSNKWMFPPIPWKDAAPWCLNKLADIREGISRSEVVINMLRVILQAVIPKRQGSKKNNKQNKVCTSSS